MRKLTSVRLITDEFADITGPAIYMAFCRADNKTYSFNWPFGENPPSDGVIIPLANLEVCFE